MSILGAPKQRFHRPDDRTSFKAELHRRGYAPCGTVLGISPVRKGLTYIKREESDLGSYNDEDESMKSSAFQLQTPLRREYQPRPLTWV